MADTPPTKGLIARLLAAATGPAGVRAADMQGMPPGLVWTSLHYLTKRGELHKAKLRGNRVHYFACPKAAAEFAAANQDLYVRAERVRAPIEQAEDRVAGTNGARAQRRDEALRLRINAHAARADQAPAVRITYGPTPTEGPLSGTCPADRPLVLRAGALDYQRHMNKYRTAGGSQ